MVWILLVFLFILPIQQINGKILQTPVGTLSGSEVNIPSVGTVFRFLKIPYAKPPIGHLRFKKPEPFGSWQGTLDATLHGPSCMQDQSGIQDTLPNKNMSEDCLHLNIFIPYNMTTDKNQSRSVMIFVHGGAYVLGQSSAYDGTRFTLRGNVLLVTVNYRLGPFGFFSTGDSSSPGNYGLWDQHLAFRWVKDNIASFGGNPNSVTIFGESAGGGSVSFQSLYPGNMGLFHRVISQSGVATSPALRASESLIKTAAMAYIAVLNCSSENTTLAMTCLRSKSAHDILSARYITAFGPSIDKEIVLGIAEEILEDKESAVYKFFVTLDYMVGSLDGDGTVVLSLSAAGLNASFENGISYNDMCDKYAQPLFSLYYPNNSIISNSVCSLYKNESSPVTQSNLALDLFSDAFFTFPAVQTADFHYLRTSAASTYMFYMTRVTNPQIVYFLFYPSSWVRRSVHAMDILLLFYDDLFFSDSSNDIALAGKMVAYWTNFAKTGNPNDPSLPFWPKYNHQGRMQILDTTISSKTKEDIFGQRIKFWLDEIYMSNVIVHTDLGPLIGNERKTSGAGSVFDFRNIPYAKPPVGNLRFRKPQPYGAWTGTLNATVYGPNCVQAMQDLVQRGPNLDISEDCLQLNIFVPYDLNRTRSVMIWVHGGEYNDGQSITLDGTYFVLRGDIILVSINYRLGSFGFLSTNDDEARGNYGLWDQHLAFKWVHDNIASFGGDPNSVTIFGQGGGGESVSFQSMYPGNRGLFQKVIAQGGVALSKLRRGDNSSMASAVKTFASGLGCGGSSNSSVLIRCLQVPSKDFVNNRPEIFFPVVDGDFITEPPEDIIHNKDSDAYKFFISLDYMAGASDGEGIVELSQIPPFILSQYNSSLDGGLKFEVLCNYLAGLFTERLFDNHTEIVKDICKVYKNEVSVALQSNAIVDFITDVGYTFPMMQSTDAHHIATGSAATYMYLLTRVNPMQKLILPQWTFPWTKRSVHGIGIIYTFLADRIFSQSNQADDMKLGYDIIGYFTNFAKKSDPNGPDLPFWYQYDEQRTIQMLDIDIVSKKNPFPDRTNLWIEKVPKLLRGTERGGPISSANTHLVHNIVMIMSMLVLFI